MKKIHYSPLRVVTLPLAGLFAISGLAVISPSDQSSAQVATVRNYQADTANPKLRESVIVRTNHPSSVRQSAQNNGVKVLSTTDLPNGNSLVLLDGKVTNQNVQNLRQQARGQIIGDVSPNYRYQLTTTIPNDTYFSQQWNLPRIGAHYAWDITKGSAETKIAVLDTGVLSNQQWGSTGPYAHPDFPSSKIWNNVGEIGATATEGVAPNCSSRGLPLDKKCNNLDDDGNGKIDDWQGWDFMGGWRGSTAGCPNHNDPALHNDPAYPDYLLEDNEPQPYSCDDYTNTSLLNKDHYNGGCGYGYGACYIGHGTSVASVAAAATNNGHTVAGMDWEAQIMNLRVLDGYGAGGSVQVAAAVEYAIAMEADVINMSLALFTNGSCTNTDTVVDDALRRAKAAGIVIVAASGNGGSSSVCYPARSAYAIAVGSSDQYDRRSSFSTYGNDLDILAPGTSIPAANAPSKARNSTYHPGASGTSLATPHVAGLAAQIKAANPGISADAVQSLITGRADKLADMNGATRTDQHGYGRINSYSTLANIGNKTPVYRLYSPQTKNHFFTASAAERDHIAKHLGFIYEGVAFQARINTSDSQPVYRLYRASTRSHLYTSSEAERNAAQAHHGFSYEGVGWYIIKGHDQVVQPIYRLYRPSTGSHLWTSSAAERDYIKTNLGFLYEGTGFSSE